MMNWEEGHVFCIDKPLTWTSTDVVRKVKFALERAGYKRIKVGHAGTLDPLATGILLVCVGRATKRVDELQAERKEYVAEVVLGATTASWDLEHPVEGDFPWRHITRADIDLVLSQLSGERLQIPPVYSAKKMEGRRAYELAREGEQVEMRRALVNIYEMELLDCQLPESPRLRIRVECSKGTYIRSLAHEIGVALGSDGYLEGLRRTRSGDFRITDALPLDTVLEAIKLTPKAL